MDAEMIRFIRQEIRKEMNVILSGSSGDNSKMVSEDIEQMYPGMPTITERPVMHPYGFASRATKGTIQVVAKQGEHTGNRVILGHRASDRPNDLSEGETAVYSVGKYQLRILKDRIELGKDGTWETAVLGDTLTSIISALVTAHNSHLHTGNLGAPTTPPLTPFISTDLTTKKHLAKDGEGF